MEIGRHPVRDMSEENFPLKWIDEIGIGIPFKLDKSDPETRPMNRWQKTYNKKNLLPSINSAHTEDRRKRIESKNGEELIEEIFSTAKGQLIQMRNTIQKSEFNIYAIV